MGTHEEILEKLGCSTWRGRRRSREPGSITSRGDMVLLEQSLSGTRLTSWPSVAILSYLPPFMLRKKYYRGVAPLATFEDALYRIGEPKEASCKGWSTSRTSCS